VDSWLIRPSHFLYCQSGKQAAFDVQGVQRAVVAEE
jgi:hypothetical protein